MAVVADGPLLALGDGGLVGLCSIELQSCLPLLLAPAAKWTRRLLSRLLHGEQVLRLRIQSAGWVPHVASCGRSTTALSYLKCVLHGRGLLNLTNTLVDRLILAGISERRFKLLLHLKII